MELCQPSTTPTEGSLMTAQCNSSYLDFSVVGPRHVCADFDGGDITSDGGGLLLRKTEELTGIIRQFAACFTDHRKPELTEHSVQDLIAQRVYALALGYEDRASAHFLVDGKELTESGRNPRKALISGVSTRRRSGRAANTVLPEQSPNRR